MQELDECFEIAEELNDHRNKITELKLKTMSPKNQIITDMPKGKGGANSIENYIQRLERLEKIERNIIRKQKSKWAAAKAKLAEKGITDNETLDMLQERYSNGYMWKFVAVIMKEKYPSNNWNENKCYRVNQMVLCKMHENDL